MGKENNLLIIGNGFDLFHGMKTSFSDFVDKEFTYFDWYILERMKREAITSRIYENTADTKKYIDGINLGINWFDLETILRDSMFFEYYNLDKYKYFINFNAVIKRWKINLRKYLKNEENKIKVKEFYKINDILNNSDSILTFNYTKTLETLYGVSYGKINYFHGSIDEDFVFGYSSAKKAKIFGKNMDKLYENDVNKVVNLDTQRNGDHSLELNKLLLSSIKEIQRFILWTRRNENYSKIPKNDLVSIFLRDISNETPESSYAYYTIQLGDFLEMRNPFQKDENSDDSIYRYINYLRGFGHVKALEALKKYFNYIQNLNIDDSESIITIIGHDFNSDIDINSFISQAVGRIKKVRYYYYVDESDDGSDKEDELRESIKESLSTQFNIDKKSIRAINLETLK
ncbi:bacteriophage abortive infection AbiH family protein [Fructilactobacillus myrtifloralis]|uniref:Bacteriophage abortive infection AbiH family protein n=1 Tax=Fructilactobacillus myrtifloralis TaxID=2940301 RepID=A0ABY5BP99_9LACO|nr:AbiH family protein [Fructilactobacillus myrtifloralis]USS85045.1 bacteriophage abortive infection AbiH family protein [Fructilactobacillus myrtifloralis]